MRKYQLILLGSILAICCWATPDFTYRYWFDRDLTNMVEEKSSAENIHISADVSALSANIHVLYLQVFDSIDTPGALAARLFVKLPLTNNENRFRYWFDSNHDAAVTVETNQPQTCIDVNSLSDGMHIINVQTDGESPSPIISAMFIKTPQIIGDGEITCVTYIDGKLFKKDRVNSGEGIIRYDVPITGLSVGLHSLGVQLVTPSGCATEMKTCYFLRHITGNELSRMRCFYSIDGFTNISEASNFDNGIFKFDLDVSSVTDGLHSINYLLTTDDGQASDIKTGMFFKIPIGGYGISEYWYWVNDKDREATHVSVESLPKEINLTELLPVESFPFRSSLFHFEIDNNGDPHCYAANEFHFRAFSNDMRSTMMSKKYTDYSVSKKVENITPLITNMEGSITKSSPESNDILWFKVNTGIGDILKLNSNNAATLQVFDPYGKEVFFAQGIDALKNDGILTEEEGVYYIALHDVSSKQKTITLNYKHIAKYAVLDFTPKEIGAIKGYIHIDLKGNGYDKLTNASLKQGTTELWSTEIHTYDNAYACLEFNIPDKNISKGKYDLVLDFEDEGIEESLTLPKIFAISEPEYGGIDVDVNTPITSGNKYHVIVTVTNTGNVEYGNVPLYFAYDNPKQMGEVSFSNFSVMTSKESIDNGLKIFCNTDNFFGQGKAATYIPTLIPMLKANESKTYDLEFTSDFGTQFNFYAWANMPWTIENSGKGSGLNITDGQYEDSSHHDNNEIGENLNNLCVTDPCGVGGVLGSGMAECLCGISLGIGETLGGIFNALHWKNYNANKHQYEEATGEPYPVSPPRNNLMSPTDILANTLQHCMPLPGMVGRIASIAGLLMPNNNCPDPCHSSIQPRQPVDPNDMLGYVAPSGSRFIKRGLINLAYTIEFENDSTLANAAAHHIVIKNQLDGELFDLSTFKPKMIKISNQTFDLDGSNNFVCTLDLRPSINVLAQITLEYDESTGLAVWDILALDPMTLDPTDHYMQGILPVNDSEGNGIGEILYDINLKENLSDGTSIINSASIKFDDQQSIITPIWENIIDSVDPYSRVTKAISTGDNKALLVVEGNDSRSGIWLYDIYTHAPESGHWTLVAENVSVNDNNEIEVNIEPSENLEFCAVAYDMAGNKENKDLAAEAILSDYILGDANNDGEVTISDYTTIINYILHKPINKFLLVAADVDKDGEILISDASSIINMLLGKLNELPQENASNIEKTNRNEAK